MAKGSKTGGRMKGTPNKATLEVKEAARQYAPAALERLAHLSRHAEREAAQVSACREILDRAYGKPQQFLEVETKPKDLTEMSDAEIMAQIRELQDERARGRARPDDPGEPIH